MTSEQSIMTSPPANNDEGDSFVAAARDVVKNRATVLFAIIVDSILLAAASGAFILLHRFIGDTSSLSIVDKLVLIGVQVLTGIGTIGTLLAWLVRDLRRAIARAWRD